MRKLTDVEITACKYLAERFPNGFCPGTWVDGVIALEVRGVLESLVRKRRAFVTSSDDGLVYTLTAQGIADAS